MCSQCENERINRAEVKELKRQIISLQAQLDAEKKRAGQLSGGYLLNSEAIDLYPGEQLDFILAVLKQAYSRCYPESRAYDILESILSVNQPVGCGKEILDKLQAVFKRGGPSTESDISDLRSIGFSYVQSRKHPKLRFYEKYVFTIPATPSDRRSSWNSLSEVSKCIAVSQKI